MPIEYEQQFRVFNFECDPWNRMTPGAVLRRAQEIAGEQCETLGIDDALYARTGTAFLLSRLSLQVAGMPGAGDVVRMVTCCYGLRRAVYHRVTSLYGVQGNLLCETDTRWVLVDMDTHHILRKPLPEFEPYFCEDPGEGRHGMEMPKPGAGTPLDETQRHAGYSMCDRNGHLNNSRYADVVCDCLPLECLEKAPVRRMLLFYRSEIPLGTSFGIKGERVEKSCYYFAAQQEEEKKFEAAVWLGGQ